MKKFTKYGIYILLIIVLIILIIFLLRKKDILICDRTINYLSDVSVQDHLEINVTDVINSFSLDKQIILENNYKTDYYYNLLNQGFVDSYIYLDNNSYKKSNNHYIFKNNGKIILDNIAVTIDKDSNSLIIVPNNAENSYYLEKGMVISKEKLLNDLIKIGYSCK